MPECQDIQGKEEVTPADSPREVTQVNSPEATRAVNLVAATRVVNLVATLAVNPLAAIPVLLLPDPALHLVVTPEDSLRYANVQCLNFK